MADFTEVQRRIISRLDRVMKDAATAGLAMRVYDGSVLMLKCEALGDPRYDDFGGEHARWSDEHTQQIGIGLDADGGAGS